MDWGDWEGARLADLRAADPPGMAANEARGLDFRPAGGESPRELQERLRPWLADCAAAGAASLAVCHKGVIRALFALATGWDMTAPIDGEPRGACWHGFALAPDGTPRAVELNRALTA